MNINLEPDTYVVAVSGGVDSMALLDILRQQPGLKLIVAHFDHGIRNESSLDRRLVQAVAKSHGLKFIYDEGNLGEISEAAARQARYNFLYRVREASCARAIITAHHQDDLLETAIHNLLRGTGRKGLTSLKSTDVIKRPLLHLSKQELIDYAKANNLAWNEDATNQDTKYRRNYIRHNLLPKFSAADRQKLTDIINNLHKTNQEIDNHLINHLHLHPAIDKLDRHEFIMLPHSVAREVMNSWLLKHDVKDISKRTLERLVTVAKTLGADRQVDVDKRYVIDVRQKSLALSRRDR